MYLDTSLFLSTTIPFTLSNSKPLSAFPAFCLASAITNPAIAAQASTTPRCSISNPTATNPVAVVRDSLPRSHWTPRHWKNLPCYT
ncbi:hypothetical protein B0H67DRAFT_588908 [Lasiosphaeris hirsuta]|uniref:Uncharacterized protein n=1 Tax=Lasiosphaeris hirsuta TaxID=260670 RepID=A0AA40A280_9PEZI|nr:hypothetical protein B0H67DRAFT_588908 [Lasiosphaeris hirsuta]